MTHQSMWGAVDNVAQMMGLSRSGLAKACGLDPTTFNQSKRWTRVGKPRWLSTATLAKVMEVAQITDLEFYNLQPKE